MLVRRWQLAQAAATALREQARMSWALWQVIGADNRLLPDTSRIEQLARSFGELAAQVPDPLPLPRVAVKA